MATRRNITTAERPLHYGTEDSALYPYESLYGDVAQLARAPALQAGGRGFESHRLH